MASIAGQARRDVRQAYRPAFKSLNRQERRIRAMDRRQRRDERAFQSWLRDTNAALNAESAQRDQQLQQASQGYDAQIRQAMGENMRLAQPTAAGVQGGPGHQGGIAPNTYSAERDPYTRGFANYAQAQSSAFGQRLGASQRRGLDLSMATEKNSYAQLAVMRAQRRSAILEALSKVAEQRGDLRAKQAADVAKRQSDMEAAAAEAQQQAFENAVLQERLANEQARIAQGDARLELSALGQSERLRQGRVRNQLARRRLTAGGRGRGGSFSAKDRLRNQGNFDSAVALARRRWQRSVDAGERRRPQPGDVAKLATWLMRATPGIPQAHAAAAARIALGQNVGRTTRRRLGRLGIRVG